MSARDRESPSRGFFFVREKTMMGERKKAKGKRQESGIRNQEGALDLWIQTTGF